MELTVNKEFTVEGLSCPSFYTKEFDKATSFYTEVFGLPQTDFEELKDWKLGNIWHVVGTFANF